MVLLGLMVILGIWNNMWFLKCMESCCVVSLIVMIGFMFLNSFCFVGKRVESWVLVLR